MLVQSLLSNQLIVFTITFRLISLSKKFDVQNKLFVAGIFLINKLLKTYSCKKFFFKILQKKYYQVMFNNSQASEKIHGK